MVIKILNFVPVSTALLLILSGCVSLNLGNGVTSNSGTSESSTPSPSETVEYLLGSKLPHGISPKAPGEIPYDKESLLGALEYFEVEEGDGESHDYTYDWGTFQNRSGVLSRLAMESNRDRDKVTLGIISPWVSVDMDGKTSIVLLLSFESPLDLKATCNGAVFEVDGFAYKVQGEWSLPCSEPQGKGDWLTWIVDSENVDEMRLLGHLGTEPFVVRLLDTEGNEHNFDFNQESTFELKPDCIGNPDSWSCALATQDQIKIALQASKAVELGLGY
jgi:hypothetical protein